MLTDAEPESLGRNRPSPGAAELPSLLTGSSLLVRRDSELANEATVAEWMGAVMATGQLDEHCSV
jgi:hypothetical protein